MASILMLCFIIGWVILVGWFILKCIDRIKNNKVLINIIQIIEP